MNPLLHRWSTLPERVDQEELLDLNEGSLQDARESLIDISRLSRWLGGNAALRRFVFDPIERIPKRGPVRILDLGSGSAALPLAIARWARRRGIAVHITGLDSKPRHLTIARAAIERIALGDSRIELIAADAQALPFRPDSFDFVISSLFMHHFERAPLTAMISAMDAVCRGSLVMHDLIRDRVPLFFFRLIAPILIKSYLTRYDGPASIRRAYTPPEMHSIAADAGLRNARVYTHGLYYRMTLVTERAPR